MKTFWRIAAVFFALWVWCFFTTISPALWWSVVVIVAGLAAGMIQYLLKTQPQRKRLQNIAKKYWWVWVPPLALSLLSSITIHWMGWSLRGTPWAYLYGIQFLLWLLVAITGWCFFSKKFSAKLGNWIHVWFSRGGFWKIWSTDNLPSNSLAVIWLILVFFTILRGPPTPAVDTEMIVHNGVQKLQEFSQSEFSRGAQDFGNFFSQSFLGLDIFHESPQTPAQEIGSRWVVGWGGIKLCFVLFPFVVFGLVWSRRDEASRKLENFISYFKKRREEVLSKISGPAPVAGAPAPASAPTGTAFSRLFASDVIANIITEGGAALVNLLRTR